MPGWRQLLRVIKILFPPTIKSKVSNTSWKVEYDIYILISQNSLVSDTLGFPGLVCVGRGRQNWAREIFTVMDHASGCFRRGARQVERCELHGQTGGEGPIACKCLCKGACLITVIVRIQHAIIFLNKPHVGCYLVCKVMPSFRYLEVMLHMQLSVPLYSDWTVDRGCWACFVQPQLAEPFSSGSIHPRTGCCS